MSGWAKWKEAHPDRAYKSSRAASKRWQQSHPKVVNKYSQNARVKVRLEALTYYSGGIPECACCHEKHIEFLAIDHIDGGGNRHRESIGMGKGIGGSFPQWLKNNEYPEGFRVLCHNCNQSLSSCGYCPHTKEAQDAD